MNCATVDELAGAYALGAVDPDEDRAISQHLASCERDHAEARSVIDAAAAVPAGEEPVAPRDALRARLMTTIATTPQDHRAISGRDVVAPAPTSGPRWWQARPLATTVAAVAVALAIGLGAWNVTLQERLASRDAIVRAIASADAAYPVSGEAGSGWVMEVDGEAMFVAADLADLPADRIYELWLIEPDGTPIAVGTVNRLDAVTAVALERGLGDATAFAVTVERERVETPTSDPVLVAMLEG